MLFALLACATAPSDDAVETFDDVAVAKVLELARPDRVLRSGPAAHLRATVLTDSEAGAGHAEVERWTGVSVGDGRHPITFSLA